MLVPKNLIVFMEPVMLSVVIAPVNENSMTEDTVVLSLTVQNEVGDAQRKDDITEFSGDNDILYNNKEQRKAL